MATLGGDLIRILAHGGISTLGNVGAQFLGEYLKNRSAEQLLGTQTSLEAATYEQDPEKQQQILRQLKDRLGLASITESGTVPIGETPTTTNLGTRKNLTYPVEGYTPATIERLVAPVPKFETAMGAKAASALPGLSAQDALSLKLKDPDRELKQLQVLGMLGDKNARTKLYEMQIRNDAEAKARHDETVRMLGGQANELKEQMLANTADRNRMMAMHLTDKTQDAKERTIHTLLGNASQRYGETPMSNVDAKVAAANKFNALYDTYKDSHPEIISNYTRLEPKTPPGRIWGGNEPLPGVAPPKSALPPVSKPASTNVGKVGFQGEGYYMIKGKRTPITSQEEYNRLMK